MFCISSSILASIVKCHAGADSSRHGEHTDQNAMTFDVLWTISPEIDECRKYASQIPSHGLHGECNASFRGASSIVTVPCHTLRHIGVNSRGEEERSSIFDVVIMGGDEHDQTGNGDQVEADHDNAARPKLVRHVTCRYGEEARNNVWGNCHELGGVILVAKVFDDCWEEKREGIHRGERPESVLVDVVSKDWKPCPKKLKQ